MAGGFADLSFSFCEIWRIENTQRLCEHGGYVLTNIHKSYEHLCRSDARTAMRFEKYHEGADYDNPEEVIIHDTEQDIEMIVTHAKNGFRVTMWNGDELKVETIRFNE